MELEILQNKIGGTRIIFQCVENINHKASGIYVVKKCWVIQVYVTDLFWEAVVIDV